MYRVCWVESDFKIAFVIHSYKLLVERLVWKHVSLLKKYRSGNEMLKYVLNILLRSSIKKIRLWISQFNSRWKFCVVASANKLLCEIKFRHWSMIRVQSGIRWPDIILRLAHHRIR